MALFAASGARPSPPTFAWSGPWQNEVDGVSPAIGQRAITQWQLGARTYSVDVLGRGDLDAIVQTPVGPEDGGN